MMDLKTALKDILPKVRLKVRHKDKWSIERPIEFHVCECGQTIDQRILDICIYTASDEYASNITKQFGHWCNIHSAPSIIASVERAKPCNRCYRWTITHAKGGVCWTCRHNPWCEMPVPGIARRVWYKAPKEHVEVETEDEI
jgi:hypothetical protein